VIAVVSRAAPHVKIPEWAQQLSAGAACMNLLTAARAMGSGASWLTEGFAFDRAAGAATARAQQKLIARFAYTGSALKPPEDRERPKLDTIVTYYDGARG